MKIFDNITNTVRDDLRAEIVRGSRVSIAAACFSMYAYQELRDQLASVEEFRFLFTSPTFIREKTAKEKREFYIPHISRETSLYGTEFEVRLRNIIEEVFAPGRAEQAREEWNRAMTDWRQAQFSFTCDKCGDPVPLPELYHMPVFITCPRCKSRVAFQPTEAMAAAPTWAKEVAKTTCYAEWQKSESEQAAEEGVGLAFFYYVDYAIAHHLMMNRLLPFYVRSQGGQEALRRDVRKALETRTHQLRPDEVSPQYHAMEYVNFMGGLGRSAQILGQEGLDDRRQLILQTVRDIMRPDEPLARSILDNTCTEELWSQQAHAADQLSCEVPR